MTLKSPRKFFDSVKAGILGPSLDNDEVSGCNAILDAMAGSPLAHTAYALATAYHETASSMQPIKEANWLSQASAERYFFRMYDIAGARPKLAMANGNNCAGDGCRFFGRGYVQMTWRSNYKRAGDKLAVNMIDNPDLALQPDIAAKIMRHGMTQGWFTGKSFNSYLPASGRGSTKQFTDARRIINGTDKNAKIAAHAIDFQRALEAGEWA